MNKAIVTLYTDGGCSPNPGLGGYAAILQSGKHERIMSGAVPDTTNYRMELLAVVKGLDALTKAAQVTVISDNNNVVRGGNEWLEGWRAKGWQNSRNKAVEHSDLWEMIYEAMQIHEIVFVKVKAHVANSQASDIEKMNNRADKLVAEARANYQPDSEVDDRHKYRLLIAGSRLANQAMIDYSKRCVSYAISQGWTIVVGDNAKGVDQSVVDELNQIQYRHVIVVGVAHKARNKGVSAGKYVRYGKNYRERDQAMARASNRGVFIWNGDSPGTKHGATYMQNLAEKTVHLMNFSSASV